MSEPAFKKGDGPDKVIDEYLAGPVYVGRFHELVRNWLDALGSEPKKDAKVDLKEGATGQ